MDFEKLNFDEILQILQAQMQMTYYAKLATIIAKKVELAFLMNMFVMEEYSAGLLKYLKGQTGRLNMLWKIQEEMMKI